MRVFYLPVLSILIFAVNIFLPRMGVLLSPFSPLLLLLYLSDKERDKVSDILSIVVLLAFALYKPIFAGYYIVMVLFGAYLILYTYQKRINSNWLSVALAPVPALLIAGVLIYAVDETRQELINYVKQMLEGFIETVKNAPETSMTPYAAAVEKNIDQAALSAVLLFPGMNYSFVSIITYFTKIFYHKIKKQKHEPFRMPDSYVWIMLAGLSFFFFQDPILRSVAFNTMLIFISLYFYQGFEIMRHWLHRFKMMGFLKAVIYIIIFSEPPLILVLSLVGLFSIWVNLYGKTKPEELRG
jgi:hypothetical protein